MFNTRSTFLFNKECFIEAITIRYFDFLTAKKFKSF